VNLSLRKSGTQEVKLQERFSLVAEFFRRLARRFSVQEKGALQVSGKVLLKSGKTSLVCGVIFVVREMVLQVRGMMNSK
jgi:hypothetical protein